MAFMTMYSVLDKQFSCGGVTFFNIRGYGVVSLDDIFELVVDGIPSKKGAGIDSVLNRSITLAFESTAPGLKRLVALGFSGGSMFLLKEHKFISLSELARKIRKAA